MRVERKVMAKDREESKHRPVAGTQAALLFFLQDEPEGQDRENVCVCPRSVWRGKRQADPEAEAGAASLARGGTRNRGSTGGKHG